VNKPTRIPFDNLNLWAIVCETQSLVRGRIQHIAQPRPLEIILTLYSNRQEHRLLISADPMFARFHLISRKPPNPPSPPNFCLILRKYLEGGMIHTLQQIEFDRIVRLQIQTPARETFYLIAELMGKHSNIILTTADDRILSAVKWVPLSKSRVRPIMPNGIYQLPPANTESEIRTPNPELRASNLSGFTRAELEHWDLEEWRQVVQNTQWQPVLIRDPETHRALGAYPLKVKQLPEEWQHSRNSISLAWEQYFNEAMIRAEAEQVRGPLLGQLKRALNARQSALANVREAAGQAAHAPKWQLYGELILAFGQHEPSGIKVLEAPDYTQPDAPIIQIPLDPEKTPTENAERYFRKARRAKENQQGLLARQQRLETESNAIQQIILKVELAGEDFQALKTLAQQAATQGWLRDSSPGEAALTPGATKQKDAFDGHKIRLFTSEDGYQVLLGENAQANDFLLTKIAHPHDWWLHVRTGTGSHVVIRTENRPEAVPKRTLEFAARLAAQNSADKHAHVAIVDYTLRKYVRKPRGAAPGFALYTHEKTLHVNLR
jgi:predicted ribosome quality control (RQC) complex YloA/Tae2 family protein